MSCALPRAALARTGLANSSQTGAEIFLPAKP
jgi:hypothetical protein